MCGLAGFVGEVADRRVRRRSTPIARSSSPIARPTRSARSSSPDGAQRHVAGERRRAVAQRVELAALLVGGDQQGRRARVERRRRSLDGRGQLADLRRAIPTLTCRNSVIPAAGAVAQPPPDVVGQLVARRTRASAGPRVERVAGVAQPRQPLTAPARPRTK